MFYLLFAALTAAAMAIPVAMILVLGAWLRGATTIAFPGPGVIVSALFALAVLTALEAGAVLGAAYLTQHTISPGWGELHDEE